jgi:ElaB/YqjD/DUF883 family membrane-anchored ribosome-binding protein
MTPETTVTKDKLVQDLKVVVADAEELLRVTANQAGEKAAVAREKIEASLERAKVKLGELEEVVIDRSKQAAHATDEYVHQHPWTAVSVAAGVGLLLGLLIGRR